MKKLTRKQWELDVKNGIIARKKHKSPKKRKQRRRSIRIKRAEVTNRWIDEKIAKKELNIDISKGRLITLNLPEVMNFYREYESTALYMNAIRKLTELKGSSNTKYKLSHVNFDNLKSISTSAALVLTAELSKWDDIEKQNLQPDVTNWDPDILRRFKDLGFFNLFRKSPKSLCDTQDADTSGINLVKYIKGRCGDNDKARTLKREIADVVGDTVCKWTFLHSGLTEAITNVTHHAYPDEYSFSKRNKIWYLSGAYDSTTKELKVVFYDQGIGIPKSLPTSQVWERVLDMLSMLPIADRKKDEVLLKAAVQLSRTSTGASDRGKGLQDLLEFIRQRNDGYLSILSLRGLYKFSVVKGKEKIKSEYFKNAINGTLIIWRVKLGD